MRLYLFVLLTVVFGNNLFAQNFNYPFEFNKESDFQIQRTAISTAIEGDETLIDTLINTGMMKVEMMGDTAYLFSYMTIHPVYEAYLHYYSALMDFSADKNLSYHFSVNKKNRNISIVDTKTCSANTHKLADTIERFIRAKNPELIAQIHNNTTAIVAQYSADKCKTTLLNNISDLLPYLKFESDKKDTLTTKEILQNPIEKTEMAPCITKSFIDKKNGDFIQQSTFDFTDFQKKAIAFITEEAKKYNQIERLNNEPWILQSIAFSKVITSVFQFEKSNNFPHTISISDQQLSSMPNQKRTVTKKTTITFKEM